jgi:hypothetical protein
MKLNNKTKEILAAGVVLVFVLLKIFFSRGGDSLRETYSFMKKVPWSIPYVVVSVAILYLISRISFFRNVSVFRQRVVNDSIENNGMIINENMTKKETSLSSKISQAIKGEIDTGVKEEYKKSTWKEILATIIYGLIFFAFIIGFFVIMMT